MREELHIEHMPELNRPILILGFEGWANGGNVAVGRTHWFADTDR